MTEQITQGKNKLSQTQFLVIFWGAMLAPLTETLVTLTASITERGAFLAPLLALPFLLVIGYVYQELCGTKGLAEGIKGCFSNISGNIVLGIYSVWGVVLTTVRLQVVAERFQWVGYKEGAIQIILPLVALFVLWMAGSHFSAFARGSTLFFGGLLVTFVVVLTFSLGEVTVYRVLPLWSRDIPSILEATLGVLGLMGLVCYTGFFLGDVTQKNDPPTRKQWGRSWTLWCVVGCVAFSLYVFIATGVFGQQLLVEMSAPFLQLAKGVRISGGVQRIESLVASLWVFSDFILLGVLLRGTCVSIENILENSKKKSKGLVIMGGIVAVATIFGVWLPPLGDRWEGLFMGVQLVLAWILPLGLFFVKKVLHYPKNSGILRTQ